MSPRLRPSLPTTTGLYLGPEGLVLATVGSVPLLKRLRGTARAEVDAGNLAAVLEAWRAEGRLRGRVVLGFDPRRTYAITRRLPAEGPARSPTEMLAADLGFAEDSVVSAMETVKLPGGPHAALAACRREAATEALKALAEAGVSRARLLPVHWALALAARAARRAPRRWKCDIRILPGGTGSLALLSWHGFPIACRPFDQGADGQNVGAVGLAVLSLVTHAVEELGLPGVDGVLYHGGPESAGLVAQCEALYGLPTQVAPPCPVDPEHCAEALARAGQHAALLHVDMFRELLPPPGLRQNFPVRTAAALLLGVGAMAFTLDGEAAALESEASKLLKQATGNARKASADLKDVPKLHEKMEAEVGVAKAFIADRMYWSELLQELPRVVPGTMTVVDFDGRDYIVYPSKKKKVEKGGVSTKRFINISGEVALDVADSSPPEVAEWTRLLEGSELLHRYLPRVSGANVRLLPAVKGLFARIMISCTPPEIAASK